MSDTDSISAFFDSELFQVIGEPIRVALLRQLAIDGPSDIGTVARHFSQDRSVISRHLQLMERAGLVHSRKVSRQVIYAIDGRALITRIEENLESLRRMVPECCGSGHGD